MNIFQILIGCLLVQQFQGYHLHPNFDFEVVVGGKILKERERNILYLPPGNHSAAAIVSGSDLTDGFQVTIKSNKNGILNCYNMHYSTQHSGAHKSTNISCVFTTTLENDMDTILFFIGLGDARLHKVKAIVKAIKVSWNPVIPIAFHHTVQLSCKVDGIDKLNELSNIYWQVNKTQIFKEDKGIHGGKYDSCGLSSTSFELCINNFNDQDLDRRISCSYGFHSSSAHKIMIHDENYICSPLSLEDLIFHRIETKILKIYIDFHEVYPKPDCYIFEGNLDKLKFVIDSEKKEGYFFNISLSVKVHSLQRCPRHFTISCKVGNKELEQKYNYTSCTYTPKKRESHYDVQYHGHTLVAKIVYDKIYPNPVCTLKMGNKSLEIPSSVGRVDGFSYNATFKIDVPRKPQMHKQEVKITCRARDFIGEFTQIIEYKETSAAAQTYPWLLDSWNMLMLTLLHTTLSHGV